MKITLIPPCVRRSAAILCVAFTFLFSGGLLAGPLEVFPARSGEAGGVKDSLPDWMSLVSAPAEGSTLPDSQSEHGPGDIPLASWASGIEEVWTPEGTRFRRSFNIPIGNAHHVLYASLAAGTIVGVQFSGSMNTHEDAFDAADAYFELIDSMKGVSWTVTGADLGWSGSGAFGPSQSATAHVFDGSLDLVTDDFYFWESMNGSPGVGCIHCTASYSGRFIVTVEYPSPVALKTSFALGPPDPVSGWPPRDRKYSYVPNPAFTVDYFYDESFGYWDEQSGRRCYDGDRNTTNFFLGPLNLTEEPVQACTFQASWDAESYPCSQGVLDLMNAPSADPIFLIRTEDYVYVPDASCQVFTPTTVHALPGVLHWMWIDFIIGGVSYERRMYFVKQ